jgi:hypothetical protein
VSGRERKVYFCKLLAVSKIVYGMNSCVTKNKNVDKIQAGEGKT